jgi:3-oxoadipate enol-lactonase
MLISTDVGAGPVVVLLHAFPLARTMWLPQVEALRDVYRVIAPDLPGFGDSPLSTAPSIDAFADAVAAHLDEKDVTGPVTVGGLSMGGYVALAYARRHPSRLAALVLADTKAEADDATARANRDKMIALASSQPASAVVEQMLPKLLGPVTQRDNPEVVAAVRQLGSAQKPETIVAALKALRDRPDATPGLKDVKVPALVIVGQDDTLTPPDVARKLANGLPRARLAVIDKAGHLANAEQPGAFNDVLMAFLAGVG